MNTSYMYVSSDDEKIELLDVQDFYGNYSGAPLLVALKENDGKIRTHLLLAEMISEIIPVFKNNDKKEKIVFFRTAYTLMSRANCGRILYAGNNGRLLESISKLKDFFHPNAEIYWINNNLKNDSSMDNIKILSMKYEDIILPSNFFDIIVAEFTDGNNIDYLKTVLINASTKWATNIYLSNMNEYKKIIDGMSGYKIYSVGKYHIYEVVISKKIKESTEEENVEHAVRTIQDTIRSSLLSLESEMCSVTVDKYGELIANVSELEQYVLNIRPYVICTDISYYINRLKESMIEYRLGFVEIQYVQQKLKECINNIERIW